MAAHSQSFGLLGILAAALSLMGCAMGGSSISADTPLSGSEIEAVLVGNSIKGDNWDGPYTVYFPTYGEMRGLRATHYKDTGTWRVLDDAICAKWEDWWGGVERCWGIYLDGTTLTWRRPDSEAPDRARLVEGNPSGL